MTLRALFAALVLLGPCTALATPAALPQTPAAAEATTLEAEGAGKCIKFLDIEICW